MRGYLKRWFKERQDCYLLVTLGCWKKHNRWYKTQIRKKAERNGNGGGLREQKGMEREQMSESKKRGSEKIN